MHVPELEVPESTPNPADPATAPEDPRPQDRPSLPLRAILVTVGTVSLVIGVLGIVVPVLPTTPFLLLAAACYARASDRLYGWLVGQRSLGPIITEWRTSRSLPPGVRVRALAVVALSFGVSIILVDGLLLRGALGATGLIVAIFLYRIPTRS
ncbi:MAG: YbaN family protein [Chloroflexi bacterium]|nr:YbaN family protein [Chloroflexota bacterium]